MLYQDVVAAVVLKNVPELDYLIAITVFILFQSSFVVQLYFIVVVHQKLRSYRVKELETDVNEPVSLIICARNEESNLLENLPLIFAQDHPDFEVVVVNDCSSDDSEHVLREFSLKYPNLKVVTIAEHERYKHGKKFAVTLGIKASANECLVFTDADCRPSSEKWLRLMARNFQGGTEIVLGYSPYTDHGGFLNRLIRFETFYTALNYLSFALDRSPYMGVGRNLAYRKSLFFKGKGFAAHMHIQSGDDDLFVNQNATRTNTVIEIHPDAHTWSEPKRTFSSWRIQKLRHQSAGTAYRPGHKRVLSLQAASALLFYIAIIGLIVINAQWWAYVPAVLIRLAIQLIVYLPIMKKLNVRNLAWWFPALDLIYYFYILALTIISLFKKKIQWK